jgi:iron-sulfur cluster insertion protein
MSDAVLEAPCPILFTDSAVAKVSELITAEGNAELKLRIYVTGGGCSGFEYGFAFDETVNEDDFRIERGGVALLIDALSMQYLEGSRFVIKNPNATTTCGCGSSFSV